MRAESPKTHHLPSLRALWKDAFGDTDDFLDDFFSTAYSPDRCLTLIENGTPVASLYWFDCVCHGRPIAYLYAIATDRAHRGHGLCRTLMEDTHKQLERRGYAGSILVPSDAGLFEMYRKMGYSVDVPITTVTVTASSGRVRLEEIDPNHHAALRRRYLPHGAVIQEGESLDFLATQCRFYAGDDVLLACRLQNGTLHGAELLGNIDRAPSITATLGAKTATFRTVGSRSPFALYRPITLAAAPSYFAFAFD